MSNRRRAHRDKRADPKPDPISPRSPVYGCRTGKIGYRSRSSAKRAAKDARKQGLKIEGVYRCRFCPSWHTAGQVQRTG